MRIYVELTKLIKLHLDNLITSGVLSELGKSGLSQRSYLISDD